MAAAEQQRSAVARPLCGDGARSAPSPRVRAARFIAAAAAALLVLLSGSGVASAHAGLISIDPPSEAVLDTAPSAITLRFTETVALHPDGIVVRDDTGTVVDLHEPTVDGGTVSQPFDVHARDGWYAVEWAIVSEDGHVVRGASVFGVGAADAAARARIEEFERRTSTAHGTDPLRAAADLLALAACGAVVAVCVTGTRRARRTGGALAAAAVVVTGGWVFSSVVDLGGWRSWWANTPGWPVALRVLALAVLALPSNRRKLAPVAAACSVVASYALLGHVRVQMWPVDGVLLAVHLAAAAAWLGAAPIVLVDLLDRRHDISHQKLVVSRFSQIATVAMPVAALAGAALAVRFGALDANSGYLWPLLSKVALVATAVAVGAATRWQLGRGRETRRRLIGTFAVDTVLLIAVSVASAALATTTPPSLDVPDQMSDAHHTDDTHTGSSTGAAMCMTNINGEMLHVMVSPGTVGTNTATISGETGAVLAAGPLTLSIMNDAESGRLDYSLNQQQPALWSGSVVVPHPGTWTVSVAGHVDRFTILEGDCTIAIR